MPFLEFNLLTSSEIKRKTVREKLPKAVSGHEAIKMLKDRGKKRRMKKESLREREEKT